MSQYMMPTDGGVRFKYGDWEIGLFLANEVSGDYSFMLAYLEAGSGWLPVARIAGPSAHSHWVNNCAAAGGMGAYIVSKFPQIRVALEKYFDLNPPLPPITNSTPFGFDDFNKVLLHYVEMAPSAGHTYPTVSQKP